VCMLGERTNEKNSYKKHKQSLVGPLE